MRIAVRGAVKRKIAIAAVAVLLSSGLKQFPELRPTSASPRSAAQFLPAALALLRRL